jgi:uracil phosphoribosyltransferase
MAPPIPVIRGIRSQISAIVIILRQIRLACGSYTLAIYQELSEQRYLVVGLRNALDQE